MRVISGQARGIKLTTVAGDNTRPTTDRVKEAIFSMIQFNIMGATCLDVFAGSGALAIEALSRGADWADLIDMSKQSQQVMAENLKKTKLADKATIYTGDSLQIIDKRLTRQYDIVFLDPPYGKGFIDLAIKRLIVSDKLQKNAIIVIEHDCHELPDTDAYKADGLTLDRQKRYGNTYITILRSTDENSSLSR